jgi:hypothetical protein
MSSMIERAKAHYSKLCNGIEQIEVNEWKEEGEESAPVIYFTPMTLADKIAVNKWAKNDAERAVEICILKCLDEKGNPIFTREHKQQLLRGADASVIEHIAIKIIGGAEKSLVEDYEKN